MWPLQRTNIYCINISDIHISCFLFRYFLSVKKKLTFCLKLYTGSQYLYCKSPRISMRLLNERLWGIQYMIYPPLLCYRKDLCIYFVNIKGFSNSFMGNQHIPTDCQTSHPTLEPDITQSHYYQDSNTAGQPVCNTTDSLSDSNKYLDHFFLKKEINCSDC